jgi:hypothetical protein
MGIKMLGKDWKCKAIPVNIPWRPIRLWDVEVPTFSRQSAHRWRRGYQTYAPATFTPRKIPDIHFCYRLSRLQGHSVTGTIRSVEKSNDIFGNRTHDLPACSIVPQPTMLLRAPKTQWARIRKLDYIRTWIEWLTKKKCRNKFWKSRPEKTME